VEEALKEREQDLSMTLISLGDAVITTDTKGCITLMNRCCGTAYRLAVWGSSGCAPQNGISDC